MREIGPLSHSKRMGELAVHPGLTLKLFKDTMTVLDDL